MEEHFHCNSLLKNDATSYSNVLQEVLIAAFAVTGKEPVLFFFATARHFRWLLVNTPSL